MRLLVKRDKTSLIETPGEAVLEGNVPEFLRDSRVVEPSEVRRLVQRDDDDDLLIANFGDDRLIEIHLNQTSYLPSVFVKNLAFLKKNPPAIWSGYRSVLVNDAKANQLYRLKGVSFNPEEPEIQKYEDGLFRVFGGQLRENTEYERKMSERFNQVLINNGIEPVMQYVGMWRYPTKAKRKAIAASIFKVQGDTRLDELMTVLENFALSKMFKKSDGKTISIGIPTNEGEKYFNQLGNFYHKLGFCVGRLKKLMDKNGQTWSCYAENTNAHAGNVVVYNGTDKLKVGLVDFDASCDSSELTRSEIKELHQREYNSIMRSILMPPISMREIGSRILQTPRGIFKEQREKFIGGFVVGYNADSGSYTNEVDFSEFNELVNLIRNTRVLTVPPPSIRPPIMYKDFYEKQFIRKETKSLDNIIRNNINYQDNLFKISKDYKIKERDDDDDYCLNNKLKSYKSSYFDD